LSERTFEAAFANVEPVGNMNKENGANHQIDDAGRANAKQHTSEDSEPARYLREPDEVTNDRGCVEKSREVLRTRPIRSAKTESHYGDKGRQQPKRCAAKGERRQVAATIEKR
jgi:hypothetical protein